MSTKTSKFVSPISHYDTYRNEHVSVATIAHKMADRIETDQQYIETSEYLLKIKEMRRRWQEIIKPAIRAAFEAHKNIKAVEKEIDQPLERAENEILKPALLRYSERREKERIAAEEKLNKMMQAEANGETQIIPTIVLPKPETPRGLSYYETYKAEVEDLEALVKAVANKEVPIDAIQPNMSFINNKAKALKDNFNYPGVVVKKEKTVRASGGANV